MPDSTLTFRPDGTVAAGDWTPSSGTLHGATSDNSDATYLTSSGTASAATLSLSTSTVPALAQIKAVAVRVRVANPSTPGSLHLTLLDPSTGGSFTSTPDLTPDATITTYTVIVAAAAPGGLPWTQAALDGLQVTLSMAQAGASLRVYEVYVDVTVNDAPAANSPTETGVDSARPTLSWTYSDAEGDPQERYQIAVYPSALAVDATAFGSNLPNAVWDSGVVISSAASVQVGVSLANSTAYTWYVRVADAGSGGRYSAVAHHAFTTAFAPSGVPVISVPYPDDTSAQVQNLTVQARPNLLTRNQADLEVNTAGWTAETNCGIARSTAQFRRGAASLAVTATAAADATASTSATKSTVEPGNLYMALVTVRPATTARVVKVLLRFYDGGGSLIGSVNAQGTEVASVWLRAWVSSRAPANAATADVAVTVVAAGAGEVHYLDEVAILPATTNPLDNSSFEENLFGWAESGTAPASEVVVGGAASGTRSIPLVTGAAENLIYDSRLAVQAGETLIVSAAFYVRPHLGDEAGPGTMTIELLWSDSTNSTTHFTDLPIGAWERRTVAVTVPASVTSAQLILTSATNILVDDVQVQRVDAGLVNGGFETSPGFALQARHDHFDGIGWIPESYPTLVAGDTSTKHTGTRALALGGTVATDVAEGTWVQVSQDAYCAGRTSLSLDYWWRLSHVAQAHAKLTFYDAARQVISPRAPLSPLPAGAVDHGTFVAVPQAMDSGATIIDWTHQSFAGIPIPDTAVWANVAFLCGWSYDGATASKVWVDDVTLTLAGGTVTAAPYTPGGWSTGGLSSTTVVLERSADGGATWAPVRWPAGDQILYPDGVPVAAASGGGWRVATVDHLAERGVALLYRATMLASDAGSTIAGTPWTYPDTVTLAADGDWLKVPRTPGMDVAVCAEAPLPSTSTEPQVVGSAVGRSTYIVGGDTAHGEVLTLSLAFDTDADWAAFEAVRKARLPVLYQTGYGDAAGPAEQLWVRLGPDRTVTRLPADGTGRQLRLVTVGARQVKEPSS